MKAKTALFIISFALVLSSCAPAHLEPAAAPTVTPAPPTETPLPTATSTPEPTATSTPVPDGPCDNPLMSLNVGNGWRYRSANPLGSSEQLLRVTGWDESVGLNAIIEMEDVKAGIITRELVTCLKGGAIEDFPLLFVSMQLGDYMEGVFNTYYESGVYSPPYIDFAWNNWMLGWKAQYLTEEPLYIKIPGYTVSLMVNRSSPIDLVFETRGEHESVTVPAGVFPQALKVTFQFTMATTLTFPNLTTGAPLTIITTQWYEPFVGLLRSEVTSASVALLPGQDSLVDVKSVVELVQYNLAP